MTRLDRFLSLYFQNMFFELNSVFSDYHSIQEHASRNKIIEFVSKKLKDLDLLKVFINGTSLLRDLFHLKFKGEDCTFYRQRILEMADFLGMLYENMKTSFIPRPNVHLAVRTLLDFRSLLPLDTYRALNTPPFVPASTGKIEEADLAYIHRLMRIHLIKEKIENFRIENGILLIVSRFFTFELALCGHYQTPQWLLFKVRSYTGIRKVEDQLMRRLTSIEMIVNFIKFFENRKNALEIFNLFENKSGFYQSFTCTSDGAECRGQFKGNDFYFRVNEGARAKEFKNAGIDEIREYVFENEKPGIPTFLDQPKVKEDEQEFRPEIFGPNRVHFEEGMFFCLSKTQNIFFFGRLLPVCGVVFHKMYLKRMNESEKCEWMPDNDKITIKTPTSDLCAYYDVFASQDPRKQQISSSDFATFVKCNIDFFKMAFILRDLRINYEIKDGLFSKLFYVDSSPALYYIDPNKARIPTTSTDCKTKGATINDITSRIRLIAVMENLPNGMQVVSCEPGNHIVLQFLQIRVEARTRVTTNVKELTDDLSQFNTTEALEYIRRFAIFYTNHLLPTFCTHHKIYIDLSNFIDEVVEITAVDDGYAITGPKTLKVSKAPKIFAMNDMKVFHVLQKIFLTDRFIFLKKNFEMPGVNSTPNEIHLNGGRRMYLTQEGIKFVSGNLLVDERITNALNFERDFKIFLQNINN